MGYAGFKLLYPLNQANDELGAFLGASYFRLLCQKAVYGLSARGLALNTADPAGEEFPVFTEFWLERPAPGAKSIAILALLESPSVAGAYRFVITPGADTVAQVRAAVYARRDVKTFGLAPLTSMYWHGENSGQVPDDFRPEVHDSDGLMLFTGAGEWLWRPLTRPAAMRLTAFADDNPRGFGLVQRDRNFESYQDLEASYHQRPSAWVEPVGAWGGGACACSSCRRRMRRTTTLWPSGRRTNCPLGEPVEFEYRLHWYLDQINPPAGAQLRLGTAGRARMSPSWSGSSSTSTAST
jgi:glucans biosynthesis protein